MKTLALFTRIIVACCLLAGNCWAEEAPLRRAAFLGAQILPSPDGNGIALGNIFPGGTLIAAGFETGDVIEAVGGEAVASPQQAIELLLRHRGGDEVELTFRRGGNSSKKVVTLVPRPFEQAEGADVLYDTVTVNGARHRSIVLRPRAEGKRPAVFYLQGYNCGSIDYFTTSPHTVREFLHELARAGYVVYRMEKRGMGDSEGEPCAELDFVEEIDGYVEGLRRLKQYDFVDPEKVFLFGHSMGGLAGPVVAAREKVAGVMGYGTGSKTWTEYWDVNNRRQMTLAGEDFVEQERQIREMQRVNAAFLVQQLPPSEVLGRNPDLAELINGWFPDGVHLFGRHYKFWQDVYRTNAVEALRDCGAPVLALWGEADFVSSRDEHEFMAEVVNHYRPGQGTFRVVPNSDHGFATHADMPAALAGGPGGGYNARVHEAVLEWMAGVLEGRE